MRRLSGCPYCNDLLLDRGIETVLSEKRANVADSVRVRERHGHRLYFVTTGTCVRLMWATEKADIDTALRARRNGQGTLPFQARVATYADLRRLTEVRTVVPT